MKVVRLYGELGKRYGKVHQLNIQTPAQAIQYFCALFEGFQSYLMNAQDRGQAFKIYVDKRTISEKGLHKAVDQSINIVPVVMGAKKGGLGQVLMGIVVVVASIFTAGAAAVAAGTAATGAGAFGAGVTAIAAGTAGAFGVAASMGMAIALGGVVSLLSPTQKGLGARNSADENPSYAFNGALNTTAQGNPVPVLYGRCIVGSATISAGIYSERKA